MQNNRAIHVPQIDYEATYHEDWSSSIAADDAGAASIKELLDSVYTHLMQGTEAEKNALVDLLKNEINGKKLVKGEKRDRMADINKFLSHHKSGTSISDVQVSELRHIVPLFLLATYPEKYGHNSCKVKGMWERPPPDWPSTVPFVDPNNNVKRTVGKGSKPTKDILVLMLKHLIKKYREKRSITMKVNPPSPHSPQQVEDNEELGFSNDVECHSNPVIVLANLISEKLRILEMNNHPSSAYLQEQYESLLLHENDVVSLKGYQLLFVIDHVIKYNSLPLDFEELLGDKRKDLVGNSSDELNAANLYETKQQSKAFPLDQPVSVAKFNNHSAIPEIMNIEPRQGTNDQDDLLSHLNLRMRVCPESVPGSGVQVSSDDKFGLTGWVDDTIVDALFHSSNFNLDAYLSGGVGSDDVIEIITDPNIGFDDPWLASGPELFNEINKEEEDMEVESPIGHRGPFLSNEAVQVSSSSSRLAQPVFSGAACEYVPESSMKLMYPVVQSTSSKFSEFGRNVCFPVKFSEKTRTVPVPFNQMSMPNISVDYVQLGSRTISQPIVKRTGASVSAVEPSARQMQLSSDTVATNRRGTTMPAAPIPVMVERENAS